MSPEHNVKVSFIAGKHEGLKSPYFLLASFIYKHEVQV